VSLQNFPVTAVISSCVDLNVFQRGGPARDLTIKLEELSGVTGGWRETHTATMHTGSTSRFCDSVIFRLLVVFAYWEEKKRPPPIAAVMSIHSHLTVVCKI